MLITQLHPDTFGEIRSTSRAFRRLQAPRLRSRKCSAVLLRGRLRAVSVPSLRPPVDRGVGTLPLFFLLVKRTAVLFVQLDHRSNERAKGLLSVERYLLCQFRHQIERLPIIYRHYVPRCGLHSSRPTHRSRLP